MSNISNGTAPTCVVCAQPASLTCVCKTRYCSVSCQRAHWKNQGHKTECKTLVKANAEAAAKASGDDAGDDAATPPPSPKAKTAPRVGLPAPSREDVEPKPSAEKRCPICVKDLNVNDTRGIRMCCYKRVCEACDRKYGGADVVCSLCRRRSPQSNEEALASVRRQVDNENLMAICAFASFYENGKYGLVKSHKKAAKLYERAVELGDDNGMLHLGLMYSEGKGVKLDKKKMVTYYRMAADRGNAIAQ